MAKLYTLTVPPVSREFAEQLKQVFRPIEITPETTMQEIQYNAGQQKVLAFILAHSVHKEISGDPNKINNNNNSNKGLLNRLYGVVKRVVHGSR